LFAGIISLCLLIPTHTNGNFVYPLDDAYIGLGVAKNLAAHRVWGSSPGQFASAASSPGFIVLLAFCFKLTGPNIYWPEILASLASFGCILVAHRILRYVPLWLHLAGLLGFVLLTPLHLMSVIGMEHSLHILLTLGFLVAATRFITGPSTKLDWSIPVLAASMVAFRYEGLFVAAGACTLLLLQRRIQASFIIAAAAWSPVFLFGLYFRAHGGEWLPNAVLLKGGLASAMLFHFLWEGLYIAPLLIAFTCAMRKRWRPPYDRVSATLAITVIAFWLHAFLGRWGWVYRYEGYLMALSLVGLTLLYAHHSKFGWLTRAALACLVLHALRATYTIPGRSGAIYSQQLQTARLVKSYPMAIALNDLGAVSYFTDVPIVDLVGLGSQDVFAHLYHHDYKTSVVRELVAAHNVQCIAVYDNWFKKPSLPTEYVRTAKLYTPAPQGYLGGNTVSFYAIPGTEQQLRTALKHWEKDLPAGDVLTFE
jgi:hypothetical protein